MTNIRIYTKTEDKLTEVVEYIQRNQPNACVSTWEPDGDGEGTWGAFVDDITASFITPLELLCEVERE